MKIYVAARYTKKDEARQVADELTALGHEVTSQWVYTGVDDDLVLAAFRDLADIEKADAILLLTQWLDGGKGMWVEVGYALGTGTPVYLYPNMVESCVFCHLHDVKVITNLEELSNGK
jgi:nucleoside 2-deoxyribosyltransferase